MKKHSGFTLIELMIVLGIVAILMAFAAPSFQNFVKNDRLSTQINTLVAHLAYARSEAVLRAQQVGLCASSNQTTCTGGDWKDGWLVYVDSDNSDSYNASTDTILRVNQALSGNNELSSTIGTNFLYDDRGYAISNGSFSLCDDRSTAYAKMIVISNTGRVRKNTGAESPSC